MKTKNNFNRSILSDNKGSAIVIAMLTLVIVTIIGISTMDNSVTEKMITTNDMLYKQAFSSADGATQVTQELIEQNIACPRGFFPTDTGLSMSAGDGGAPLYLKSGTTATTPKKVNRATGTSDADIAVVDNNFAIDGYTPPEVSSDPYPSNTLGRRDIYMVEKPPLSDSTAVPHTNIVAAENVTKWIAGNSILMAEGYSGLGKGGGSGGANILYNIHSKYEFGARNSCSHIVVEYRHLVGREGDCEYQ